MSLTAAVINAGIGDLSLGLQMAGFQIAVAFEPDERATAIHRTNLHNEVVPLSLDQIEPSMLPNIDLLAARIRLSSRNSPVQDHAASNLLHLLECHRPRGVFLTFGSASPNQDRFNYFLDQLVKMGYRFQYRKIDVAQAIGIPVKESILYLVATAEYTSDVIPDIFFPKAEPTPIYSFLRYDEPVDPWYYQINFDRTPIEGHGRSLLCWKNNCYMDADLVQWNPSHIPLINDGKQLRKLTHREIARMKGFPEDYRIEPAQRSWLYKQLMQSENIYIIRQIAESVRCALPDSPWRSQQQSQGVYFEELFGRYLEELSALQPDGAFYAERPFAPSDSGVDFLIRRNDTVFAIKVKYFRTNNSIPTKMRKICGAFSTHIENATPILVTANEVPKYTKEECYECYGVHIWDVSNLLWLFESAADIKSEFIAFLDYSVDHIEPTPPTPALLPPAQEKQQKELDLREQLRLLPPGKDDASKFEILCTDILKYILGDYLTLWKTQQPSNDGLYRFDLCCKIKTDVDQDFFDTVKNYFRTKYIVFEFKNYSERITQKEIYTTEKYLYEKALRKVAIIISRSGADAHALWAAKGSLRENGKLILCLSDQDLVEMLDMKDRGELPAEFLSAMLDDLLMHLEK